MASKDTEGAVKADNPTSDHNRELNKELSVGTVQSRKSLVTSATEGEMAPETWYYTWRAMRERFYPHYVFYPQDPRFWDDDGVYWDYTLPMTHGISYNSLTRIPMNGRPKPDTESSSISDDRRQIVYRKYCTCFLVVIGILLLLTAIIPVLLHIFLGKDSNTTDPEAVVQATLVIDNLEYSPDLTNTSHPRFTDVEQTLRKEIDELFSNSDIKRYYKGSEVTKIRNASSDTQVFLDLRFNPIDRKIPLYRQLNDILRSVPRDRNDSSLGVLGKYRFKIESLNMYDTDLIYSPKNKTKEVDRTIPALSSESITEQTNETVPNVNGSGKFDVAKHLIRINISPDQKDTVIQRPISHSVITSNDKETTLGSFITSSPSNISIITDFNETQLQKDAQKEIQNSRETNNEAENASVGNNKPVDHFRNKQSSFNKEFPYKKVIGIAGGRPTQIESTTPLTALETSRSTTFLPDGRGLASLSSANLDRDKDATQSVYEISQRPASVTRGLPSTLVNPTMKLTTSNTGLNTAIPEATGKLIDKNIEPFRSLEALDADYPKHLLRGAYTTDRIEAFDSKLFRSGAEETTTENVMLATTEQYDKAYTVNNDLSGPVLHTTTFQDWYDLYDIIEHEDSESLHGFTDSLTTSTPATMTTTLETTTTTTTPTTTTTTLPTPTTPLPTPSTTLPTPTTTLPTTSPSTTTTLPTTTLPTTTTTLPTATTTLTSTTTTWPTPTPTTTLPTTTTTLPTTTTTLPTTTTTWPTTTTSATSTTLPTPTTTLPTTTTPTPTTTLPTTTTTLPTTTLPTATTTLPTTMMSTTTTTLPTTTTTLPTTTTTLPTTTTSSTTTTLPTTETPLPTTTTTLPTTTTTSPTTTTSLPTTTTSSTTTTLPTTTTTLPTPTTTLPTTTTTLHTTTTTLPTTTTPTTTTTLPTTTTTLPTTTTPTTTTTLPTPTTSLPTTTTTLPTTTTPTTTTTLPTSTTTLPTTMTTLPTTTTTLPTTMTTLPTTSTTWPTFTTTLPTTTTTLPTTTAALPTTTTTLPTTMTTLPTTTTYLPTITTTLPTTTTTLPTTTTTLPTTTTHTTTTTWPTTSTYLPTTTTKPASTTTSPTTTTTTPATTTHYEPDIKYLWNVGFNLLSGLDQPDEKWEHEKQGNKITSISSDQARSSNIFTVFDKGDILEPKETLVFSNDNSPVAFSNLPGSDIGFTSDTERQTVSGKKSTFLSNNNSPIAFSNFRSSDIGFKSDTERRAEPLNSGKENTFLSSDNSPVTFSNFRSSDIGFKSDTERRAEPLNSGKESTFLRSDNSPVTFSNLLSSDIGFKSDTERRAEPLNSGKESTFLRSDNSPVTFSNLRSSDIGFKSDTERRAEPLNSGKENTFVRNLSRISTLPEQRHTATAGTKISESNSSGLRRDSGQTGWTENEFQSNMFLKVPDKMDKEAVSASDRRSFDISNQFQILPADRNSGLNWLTPSNFKTKDRKTNSLNSSHLASSSNLRHQTNLTPTDHFVSDSQIMPDGSGTTKPVKKVSKGDSVFGSFPIVHGDSRVRDIREEKAHTVQVVKPNNINEMVTRLRTTKRIAELSDIILPTTQASTPRSTIEGANGRKVNTDVNSVVGDEPVISFTIDGSTASGSSVLLSWKLGGIQGWSNIVLERILTNGESERLVAISPGVEIPSSAINRLKVSQKSHITAENGSIMIEIADLQCEDEGTYLAKVLSNGIQVVEKRTHLVVSGAPGAKVVVPDDIFEGQPVGGVKCIASLGYPPGKLIMRVKYPDSTSFLNTIIDQPLPNGSQQLNISRTCGPVVEKKFEDVLDVNRDLNNTLLQCGVTGTPAIRPRTGVAMSTFKYIRIIPGSLCSSTESWLIRHPFNTCSYIDCLSMTVNSCPEDTCFDPETEICSRKQTSDVVK